MLSQAQALALVTGQGSRTYAPVQQRATVDSRHAAMRAYRQHMPAADEDPNFRYWQRESRQNRFGQ